KAPFATVRELIAYAKANPGKLSNASSSNGSPGHVSGELFKYMTGTEVVHVPYKGGAPAIGDLIAGNVQLMFESTNSIAPHVKAGRVRALAVTGLQRAHSLPDVPTMIEAGVPGYEVNAWSGVIAPAGLPRRVLLGWRWRTRAASAPVRRGMRMSSTTMSGWKLYAASIAARPS